MSVAVWRCSNYKCKKRVAFSKLPDEMVRPPKCKGCGGTKFRYDKYRALKEDKKPCTCPSYHFPHSRRSVWCEMSKNKPTEDHYRSQRGLPPAAVELEETLWQLRLNDFGIIKSIQDSRLVLVEPIYFNDETWRISAKT